MPPKNTQLGTPPSTPKKLNKQSSHSFLVDLGPTHQRLHATDSMASSSGFVKAPAQELEAYWSYWSFNEQSTSATPLVVLGLNVWMGTAAGADAGVEFDRINRFKLFSDKAGHPRRILKSPRSKESDADSERAGAADKCTKSTDILALQCMLPSGAPPACIDERLYCDFEYCNFEACDWLKIRSWEQARRGCGRTARHAVSVDESACKGFGVERAG